MRADLAFRRKTKGGLHDRSELFGLDDMWCRAASLPSSEDACWRHLMLLILGMGIEAEAAEVVEPVPGHVLGTGRSAPIVDDRTSVVKGKRVSVRVDLGGRSLIKNKKKKKT